LDYVIFNEGQGLAEAHRRKADLLELHGAGERCGGFAFTRWRTPTMEPSTALLLGVALAGLSMRRLD